MRVSRAAFVALLGAAAVVGGSGCIAHRRVGRPPSAGEIAVINDEAMSAGPLLVEARGAGTAAAAGEWVALESADVRTLTLRARDGRRQSVPLDAVAGVSFENRGRGALVGAVSLGVTSAAMGWGFAAAFKENDCSWDCAGMAAIGLATGALAGAAIGYLIGGRTVFMFTPD